MRAITILLVAAALASGLVAATPEAKAAQRAQNCVVLERGEGVVSFRNHCGAIVNVEYNVTPDRVCGKLPRDYYPCAAIITPSARHVIGEAGRDIEWAACIHGYVRQVKPWDKAYECR